MFSWIFCHTYFRRQDKVSDCVCSLVMSIYDVKMNLISCFSPPLCVCLCVLVCVYVNVGMCVGV